MKVNQSEAKNFQFVEIKLKLVLPLLFYLPRLCLIFYDVVLSNQFDEYFLLSLKYVVIIIQYSCVLFFFSALP